MIPKPQVSKELLKKLLYGCETEEQLSDLLREYPKLDSYHHIATPMHQGLEMVMTVIGQQLIEVDYDITSIEEIIEMSTGKGMASLMIWDKERLANHPTMPDDVIRDIIVRVDDLEDALDVSLTIHAGLEFPDYLTEESYWMVSALDGGPYAKFLARCLHALEFCLVNDVNKQFILKVLESSRK